MIFKPASLGAGILAASALGLPAMTHAQALSQAEVERALTAEAASRAEARPRSAAPSASALPGLAQTRAGAANKSVVSQVTPAGSPGTAGAGSAARALKGAGDRRAIVTRYDYATGVTTRTTVDLGTGKTLATREDANYPTPLAPEELEQAKTLARSADADLDAIIGSSSPDKLQVLHLVPVDSDPASARFGHRLVILWTEQPKPSQKVLVDLSTEEAVPYKD